MRLLLLLLLFVAPRFSGAAWVLSERATLSAPTGVEFTERKVSSGSTSATLWVVRFDPRAHTFAVMDNPDGAYSLGTAAEKRGALAGVNGGYFHPDRTPVGLVIRKGAELHPLEKAKLLSGVVSVAPGGMAIQRSSAFRSSPAVREALQAGPFLVEAGRAMRGLDTTRTAARTVVFQDAGGRAGLLICKSVSLAEMAAILETGSIFPEGKVMRALNLDGGSSTALWVRGEPPFYQREWKTVRNYLAIIPKP